MDKNAGREKEKKHISKGIFVEVAAYMGIAATAVYASWITARNKFFHEFKGSGEIAGVEKTIDDGYRAITGLKGKEYVEKYMELNRAYTKVVTAKMEEKGFTNAYQKFRTLGRNSRLSVAITFASVISVGIGIIATLKGTREIENKLQEIEKRQRNEEKMISPT